jgi:hypothetical protein
MESATLRYIINTWRVSFDLIKARVPRAADILSVRCFLNCHCISRSLLFSEEEDGVEFTKALAPLLAFRLISVDKSKQEFSMHRLVQLSTRAWLAANREIVVY